MKARLLTSSITVFLFFVTLTFLPSNSRKATALDFSDGETPSGGSEPWVCTAPTHVEIRMGRGSDCAAPRPRQFEPCFREAL